MEMKKKTLLQLFLGVGGCILLYWALHETERVSSAFSYFANVFSPFVLGAALAFILNVPVRAFERMLSDINRPGSRRMVAVLLTFVSLIVVLAVVFLLLIPQITQTVQTLIPKVQTFFNRAVSTIRDFLNENPEMMQWLVDNTEFEKLDWESLLKQVMTVLGGSVSLIANGAVFAIGSVVDTMVDLVIGLVFALYCLFGKETLARQGRRLLYAFLPEKHSDVIIRVFRLTNTTFSNFISGQCLEACILGGLFAVAMALFGMPYIPLISVLIAVTALVPVVGAFIGCFLGAFFILVDSPIMAVWFVVMFLVLQQIEGNLIYPKVVGNSIGLPGMWVLLAVTIGAELMGVAGMLLMIPLMSVFYTLLREITYARLEKRGIAQHKLQPEPLVIKSKFKEKREQRKHQKRIAKGKDTAHDQEEKQGD